MTTHSSRRAWAHMVTVHQQPDVRLVRLNPRPAKVRGEIVDRSRFVSAGARGTVAALTDRVVPQPHARAC